MLKPDTSRVGCFFMLTVWPRSYTALRLSYALIRGGYFLAIWGCCRCRNTYEGGAWNLGIASPISVETRQQKIARLSRSTSVDDKKELLTFTYGVSLPP